MNTVFDASAVINLVNADLLELVLDAGVTQGFVSPVVLTELSPEYSEAVLSQSEKSNFLFIPSNEIPAEVFLNLLATYGLGEGETECICVCEIKDYAICCDDRKARRVASEILGQSRVTGSLGLLRTLCRKGKISVGAALEKYEKMKLHGGFLPTLDRDFFQD